MTNTNSQTFDRSSERWRSAKRMNIFSEMAKLHEKLPLTMGAFSEEGVNDE